MTNAGKIKAAGIRHSGFVIDSSSVIRCHAVASEGGSFVISRQRRVHSY